MSKLIRIGNYLKPIAPFSHRVTWALLAALVVGLTLVLSVGQSLQTWVVALIASDRVSIHDRVYQDALIAPLSFKTWIEFAADIQFALMATAIVTVSFTAQKPRRIVLHLIVSTTFVLTLNDLIRSLREGTLTASDMAVNLSCNFFGSVAIAAWIVGTLKVSQFLILKMIRDRALCLALALIAPIFLGLLTTAVTFETCKILFAPVPMRIDANLRPGAAALYALDTGKSDSDEGSLQQAAKPFNPLNLDGVRGKFSIISPSAPLSVSWTHPAGSERFDLIIHPNSNCPMGPGISIRNNGDELRYRDVHRVLLNSDRGGEFSTIGDQVENMHVGVEPADKFRWIILEKGDRSNTFKIAQIVTKASANYAAEYENMNIYFGAFLLDVNKEAAIPSDRILSLAVDNEDVEVRFSPMLGIDYHSKKVACQQVDLPTSVKNGTPVVHIQNGVAVGYAVTIQPETIPAYETGRPLGKFDINGVSGFVLLDNIPDEQISTASAQGKTSLVILVGKSVALKVDDKARNLDPDDQLSIQGPLSMRFADDNHLEISGVGKYVYKNQVRYNRTVWENWDVTLKVTLITALFTLLCRLAWLLWKWLKDDEKVPILERN